MYFFAENAPRFGAYIPFLQLAFGFNLILGMWDKIYQYLEKSYQKQKEIDNALSAKVDAGPEKTEHITAQHDKCDALQKQFRRIGLWLGIITAALIAILLLLVPPTTPVNSGIFASIVLIGFAMPLLMGVMYAAGKFCHRKTNSLVTDIARNALKNEVAVSDGAVDAARDVPSVTKDKLVSRRSIHD